MPATIRFILYQTGAFRAAISRSTKRRQRIMGGFLRRIHKVITYDDKGKKIIYPSVQAYFERDTDFRTLTAGEQQKLPFAEKKD